MAVPLGLLAPAALALGVLFLLGTTAMLASGAVTPWFTSAALGWV